ncbi:DUF6890 family protein [Microbulbifer sp. SSSA005]
MLVARYFPGAAATEENMARALYLEQRECKNLEIAVANGIARALTGK